MVQNIFGSILIAIGIFALYIIWSMERQADEIKTWPVVSGVVVESRLESEWDNIDNESVKIFSPYVRYSYSVDGRQWVSHEVYAGGTRGSSSEAKETERLAKYSKDAAVTVHYNPQKPSEAYLETESVLNKFYLIPVGLVFLGAGLYFLFGPRLD